MKLFRARSLSSRPGRLPAFEGNEPSVRIRGRWFTSVKQDALDFGTVTFAKGAWELVSIDVPDAIVDSFRVATTPNTVDGLSPIDFADKPETEYVVQTFRVMDAVTVAVPSEFRVRDYILVDEPPRSAMLRQAAADLGVPYMDLVRLTQPQPGDAAGLPLAA